MNRVLLLISAIWVAMLLTPTVADADAEIVLIGKEIDDDHIIIRRENGERLLLEKWSLRFSPLSFEGKTFVASVSPMRVTIYLDDRDEIKWSIEERLEAARFLHRTVPGTIQQPRRGSPAKTLDPTFILLVQGALSLLGLEPGPLNGVMAEQTRTAIREFQRREKLAADGVPGQATCLALATGLYRKLDCCDLLGQGQHSTLGPGQILCPGQGGA